MKKKDRGRLGSVITLLLRPIECIEGENDAEMAILAFRQACRGAHDVEMELVGDFTYTGKKQQITIKVRNIDGA